MDAAAPAIPMPEISPMKPLGENGSKLSMFITGTARMMNSVSAATLMLTRMRVHGRALTRTQHQQARHQQRNDRGRDVHDAADVHAAGECGRQVYAEGSLHQADEIIRPSHRDRARGDGVFEDQGPARPSTRSLHRAPRRIRVGGAGDRHHRRQLPHNTAR